MPIGHLRIGISGWRYKPWRGNFYVADLPQRAELQYASCKFPTLEINGTFYSLQTPASFAHWYQETPPGFVFAVKGGRYITHMRKLNNIEIPLANFFASGLFNLKEKVGPVLWQFPPNFKYNAERMESFFSLLPRDTQQALALARRRDERLKGRARLAIDEPRELRHAVEIRHTSFLVPGFVDLLREYNIAWVIADTAGRWPMVHDITADFVYIRLHGDTELYQSGYTDEALERWAKRIKAWARGTEPTDAQRISTKKPPRVQSRDVYCYFDNTDVKLRAPVDALALLQKLKVQWPTQDIQTCESHGARGTPWQVAAR